MMQLNILQVDINVEKFTEDELKNLKGESQAGAGNIWRGIDLVSIHWPQDELPTTNHLNIIIQVRPGKHCVDWFAGISLIMFRFHFF